MTVNGDSAMNDFQLLCSQLRRRARPHDQVRIEPERVRQAAVTILLREQGGAGELLIIRRAEHPSDPWSGHLALPGGRADGEDINLIATAARETYEEVGIRLDVGGSFIGQLEAFAPSNPRLPLIEITPLIALAPREVTLRFSDEVADAFWLPVRQLKEAGLSDVFHLRLGDLVIKRPAYPSPQGPIWGITERILTTFLGLLD